jgi:CheY-like chemotaxis protein
MSQISPVGYVLIADDDFDDIDILSTALKEIESGLEVMVAENGKRVLEQLQNVFTQAVEIPPCVLVMDMNMPKMDGRETVVALKTHGQFKNIPILLFSNAKNKTDELFAEKWGVHYYQKPDTMQGMSEMARVILNICRTV